ncbi:uncharacterized protein SCHCODRAFT_02584515, partial [Schizophyllum commune H4-8]|uniref:uncharacterized protein n=1 Tax=Schizophyllum commune (strain H4-8 / FGSC 9210) TaxID=578458 RepID=UPI00215FD852
PPSTLQNASKRHPARCLVASYRHVPDTDTRTRQHILAECPQYEEHRYLLRDASRGLSLPVLLGTKKGIAALTEFIAASGAFTKTGAPRAPPSLPTWEQEPEVRQDDENGEDG